MDFKIKMYNKETRTGCYLIQAYFEHNGEKHIFNEYVPRGIWRDAVQSRCLSYETADGVNNYVQFMSTNTWIECHTGWVRITKFVLLLEAWTSIMKTPVQTELPF